MLPIHKEVQTSYRGRKAKNLLQNETLDSLKAISYPFHYCNKMKFSFFEDKFIFLEKPSIPYINLHKVSQSWMIIALNAVRTWWKETGYLPYFQLQDTGTLQQLTLRGGDYTGDKMAILSVSGRAEYAITKTDLNLFVEMMNKRFDNKISLFLHICQSPKKTSTPNFHWHLSGTDHIREKVQSGSRQLKCKVGPVGFFPPSTKAAELLIKQLRKIVKPMKKNRLLELYCGSALLSMALSDLFTQLTAIEICKESILDAKDNLKMNNIYNIKLIEKNINAYLQSEPPMNLVLIDSAVVKLDSKILAKISANQIIYLSSSAKAQREELQLFKQLGFHLQSIHPVGLFPEASHIENILHFKA